MKAIKAKVSGKWFLFPDGFDFIFPDYITEHMDLIKQYIVTGDETLVELQNFDYSNTETTNTVKRAALLKKELAEFKARTGIIGYPFDLHDVDMYILSNDVDIVQTVELN